MIITRHTTRPYELVGLVCLCLVWLVACGSSENSSALCETHFKANSQKIAQKHCQKASDDGDALAQYYLGLILVNQGKPEEGHILIEQAAQSGFKKALFHKTVEVILEESDPKRAAEAVKQMQQFAESGDDVAQYWMGNIFLFGHAHQKRSPNEASYWYEKAIKQDNYRAMNNLAWIKSLARDSDLFDPEGAVLMAQKVVAKHPKSHGYLDTLAAAYAANGQFDAAIQAQKEVLQLAQSEECERCGPRLIDYYQGHLELYLQEKPLEEDLLK